MSFLGLTQRNRNRFFYQSPYQDIAQSYLPVTAKELFQYTKYYYRVNPVIAPIIDKMAEYPITNFVVDVDDAKWRTKIEQFLGSDLHLRETMIGMGQDWGVFGNSFVSIIYPFTRHIHCVKCDHSKNIEHFDKWNYKDGNWSMFCPKCGTFGEAKIQDTWIPDSTRIRFHRWTVEQMDVQFNEFTGETKYYYRITPKQRKKIKGGIKHYVAKTPKVFLDAVKEGKDVLLNIDNLFHFKRTSIADELGAWGVPIMYPALKEAFHWQVLRKANESIAMQYIVPMTVLFPQPHGEANPYTHLNLNNWRRFVEQQIHRWKRDPNHIPIMPIPMGSEQIFGNARALMVGPEMQQVTENIIAACQVPREFVFGGLSYSGTSVSLRMLENHFLVYREQLSRFLRWVSQKMHVFLKWPEFTVRMSDFKMADDIQKKNLMLQMNQMRKVSDGFILEDAGLNFETEYNKILEEVRKSGELAKMQQMEAARAQGEAMKIQAKSQVEAEIEAQQYRQTLMENIGKEEERRSIMQTMENNQPQNGIQFAQFDPMQLAGMALDKLKGIPPEQRGDVLKQLQSMNPQLLGVMNQVANSRVSQQPNPEQRPPRRGPGKAAI